MICSSLARNRSPDPVVSCCFGRIVPSDATTESQFVPKGNPENEIARFRALKPQYLAISILPARQKQILRQWASRCSQTTIEFFLVKVITAYPTASV
jgi:hypothetical protein